MEQETQGRAPLIGAVIIIIIILVGGFYLWKKSGTGMPSSSSQASAEDVASLEKEITELSSLTDELDAGLRDIDMSLQ